MTKKIYPLAGAFIVLQFMSGIFAQHSYAEEAQSANAEQAAEASPADAPKEDGKKEMKKAVKPSKPVANKEEPEAKEAVAAKSESPEVQVDSVSSRGKKSLGFGVGLITEPVPSLLGFTVAYNFSEHFRLTGGYGSISASGTNSLTHTPYSFSLKTYGLDAKFFPLAWNFAPFISGGASLVSGSITGTGTISGLSSFSSTGTFYDVGAGIDWQTNIGFNIGFEFKRVFGSTTNGVTLPGIYFGWFF